MGTIATSEAFQKFAEATESIMNPAVQAWLDQGGKVAGYFCSSVPEEILMAAGYLPFRIRGTGSENTELSDAFFSPINCSFPRHAFNLALKGEYAFLDALICINSCDHVRRVYDNWIKNVKTRNISGSGLGLSITKKIISLYNGKIELNSEVDKGTKFTIILPLENN